MSPTIALSCRMTFGAPLVWRLSVVRVRIRAQSHRLILAKGGLTYQPSDRIDKIA